MLSLGSNTPPVREARQVWSNAGAQVVVVLDYQRHGKVHHVAELTDDGQVLEWVACECVQDARRWWRARTAKLRARGFAPMEQ